MILLYGVISGSEAAKFAEGLPETGVQDQPVELVSSGAFAVLASPVNDPEALRTPDVRVALAHKNVVDAAFENGTVLPMRFGTCVASRAALPDVLGPQADRYRILLDRLDGHAEMGLRLASALHSTAQALTPEGAAYRSDRPGTAYLLARQRKRSAEERAVHRIVQAFRDKLSPLTTDSSFAVDPAGEEDDISVAFLVPRDAADAFREEALQISVPGVSSAEVVGPWAPYSFV